MDHAGFALTVDTDFHIGKVSQRYIGVPYLREATPFEYLARLRLFNLTFRDFIEFEGVIDDPGKEAIITSQEFINGQAAASDEVEAFMTERGFVAVPGVVAGRGNSMSYFYSKYGSAYGDPIEIVNARVTAIGRRPSLRELQPLDP